MSEENVEVEEYSEEALRNAFVDAVSSEPDVEPQAEEPVDVPEQVEQEPDREQEQQQAEPEQSSSLDSLLETAREYGISTDGVSSEAELSERVLGQIQRMQGIVSESQSQLNQYQQYYSQQNDAPQQSFPKPEKDEWNVRSHLNDAYGGPSWNQDHARAIDSGVVVQDEETGLYIPAKGQEGVAGQIAQEMNAAQQHSANFWRGMARDNPYEKIYDVLSKPIEYHVEQRVNQILDERMNVTRQEDLVSTFEKENSSWMYEKNPDTGQNVLSQEGARFVNTVQSLRADGINDPSRLLDYAQKMTGLGGERPAPVPQQQAAPQATEATPAQPAEEAPVIREAQQQSFLESAQRRASHSPSARGRASEDAPQVMTQGDLESYFIRAQRQSSST